MELADGLFRNAFNKVAGDYPTLETNDIDRRQCLYVSHLEPAAIRCHGYAKLVRRHSIKYWGRVGWRARNCARLQYETECGGVRTLL